MVNKELKFVNFKKSFQLFGWQQTMAIFKDFIQKQLAMYIDTAVIVN